MYNEKHRYLGSIKLKSQSTIFIRNYKMTLQLFVILNFFTVCPSKPHFAIIFDGVANQSQRLQGGTILQLYAMIVRAQPPLILFALGFLQSCEFYFHILNLP